MPVWNRLVNRFQGTTHAVVAHGTVIKALLLSLDSSSFNWDTFRYPNLGIIEATNTRTAWSIVRHNTFVQIKNTL